jgi:hypothetical protein
MPANKQIPTNVTELKALIDDGEIDSLNHLPTWGETPKHLPLGVNHAWSWDQTFVLAGTIGSLRLVPRLPKREEVQKDIEALTAALAGPTFRCMKMKGGKPCTQQHDGKLDRDDRPVFYYATGCRIVESFCPACLAYWHVAVARNCLFDYARFCAEDAAAAARS